MAKKRVTRKRVNDPTINEALRDIYDKIDGLQPNSSDYITPTPPVEGDILLVTEDEDNQIIILPLSKAQELQQENRDGNIH